MKTFKFQTGRWYGPDGQLIEWYQNKTTIAFWDHTRSIIGKFNLPDRYGQVTDYEGQQIIMRHYDNGIYENITEREWQWTENN